MTASSVTRFGGLGVSTDAMRCFNRGLELVSSTSLESENELLDLVKKARLEDEKEKETHPSQKSRADRIIGDSLDLQCLPLPHKTPMVPIPQEHSPNLLLGEHTSSQLILSWSTTSSGTTSSIGSARGNASMTQAQARSTNVSRDGLGCGRIEKPKRRR